MNFGQCCVCGLNLPVSYLSPIIVNHQGRNIRVLICEKCKKQKEEEAKRRQNG